MNVLGSFHVSGKRVRQTHLRFKIQQCWISAVAACVCLKEIPLWRHYYYYCSRVLGKPTINIITLERISVPARVCRTRLPYTWKGSWMRLPGAVRQTCVTTGHMELRPKATIPCVRLLHAVAAPFFQIRWMYWVLSMCPANACDKRTCIWRYYYYSSNNCHTGISVPARVFHTCVFAGHMERKLNAVAGRGAATGHMEWRPYKTPHRDEWGARSEWKNPRTIPNHTHNFTFSLRNGHSWRSGAGDTYLPTGIRTAAMHTKVLPYHYISMPYEPNFTNKFAIPHVCLYHVYSPAVHSCPNELYNIHGDTHAKIKITVQSEHEPYQSNGDTLDTNPLRIIRTT